MRPPSLSGSLAEGFVLKQNLFNIYMFHSSRRAVQFSPILGPVRRFGAQNAGISSHLFATSGFCNVGSPTL